MAKVLKDFYCIKEKKSYKKGEQYTGKRTDIDHLLLKKATKKQETAQKKNWSASKKKK